MIRAKLLQGLLLAASLLLSSCGGSGSVPQAKTAAALHMQALAAGAPAETPRLRMGLDDGSTELIQNPGFENGDTPWVASSMVITTDANYAHGGSRFAWLGGYDYAIDYAYQDVAIPATASSATLQFWYYLGTDAPAATRGGDTLGVQVLDPASGAVLRTLLQLTNAEPTTGWTRSPAYDLSAYKGKTIRLRISMVTDASGRTDAILDDFSLKATLAPVVRDKLTMPGKRSSYTLTGSTTTGMTLADSGGVTQSLAGVKRLQFSDSMLAFDLDGVPGQIYRLYQAAFDRQPDLGGLGYWINAAEKAPLSLLQVSENFIGSPEFLARYGNLSDSAFVSQLYANVLHRQPDAAGLEYHVGTLARKALSRAGVLVSFSDSAENVNQVLPNMQQGIAYVPPELAARSCDEPEVLIGGACVARPLITRTAPASGAVNVSTSNIFLELTFNQLMDRATLAPAKVSISPAVKGGQETWTLGPQSVWRYMPSGAPTAENQLAPNTRYTVTVADNVAAASGATLGAVKTFSFTTSASCAMGVASGNRCVAPSCPAPQVLSADWVCVAPGCPANMVMQNGVCVPKPVSCTPPQVLQNGSCVTPAVTCELPRIAQNGVCVYPPGPIDLNIKSTSPASGAVLLMNPFGGTSPTRSVVATFDQELDPSTVTATSFGVLGVDGTTILNGNTIAFTTAATSGFPPGVVTAFATQAVRDRAGRRLARDYSWTFTVDNGIRVSPANNTSDVSPTTTVTAQLEQSLLASSVTAKSFLVTRQGSETALPGTVSYEGKTLVFRPSAAMPAGEGIIVRLTADLKDASGKPLLYPFSWIFRIKEAPPVIVTCTPPKVLQNGVCVTPAPVTCTPPKVLQNGVCVTSSNPSTGSTTPDADGCFVPQHNPECLVVESQTYDASNYINIKYRNNCGARVLVIACNALLSGKQDCGMLTISAGGLSSWYSYGATGSYSYPYTGSIKALNDYVCRARDPRTK